MEKSSTTSGSVQSAASKAAASNLLRDRDYTLIVDKSGSMSTSDTAAGSRWKAAQEATLGLASKIHELDPDGITVYAFSNRFHRHENVTPQKVSQLFQEHEPNGSTNLAAVLQDAFDSYFARKARGQAKANGETFLVVTDGTPDDQAAVAKVIAWAANKIDRDEELAVSFIQVGNDSAATQYLKMLDDSLQSQGAKYDIVDTITIEEMGNKSLSEVLMDAITN